MHHHPIPTIVITGATGFLGSHLMTSLLAKEYRVIVFGRGSNGDSLRDRIVKLLRWFGIEHRINQLKLVETDFAKERLGLPEEEYKRLCMEVTQMIHCASDTRFAERRRREVFQTNVQSLQNVLTFAADAQLHFFHYISTAYAAGIHDAICKEKLTENQNFVNVYEESKAQAEKDIAAFCRNHSVPFTIIRPTIVYGDARTGRSLKFNALYYPIRSLQIIRDIYLNDIKNADGIKSGKHGIFINEEGYLFLPLKIGLPTHGALNLIPVDYFTEASLKIIHNPKSGQLYHLSNPKHTALETVLSYNEKFMKLKGVEVVYGESDGSRKLNPAEQLFNRFIKAYLPYMHDNRTFHRANADEATGNLHPPEFNRQIFDRCMGYAVKVEWGGKWEARREEGEKKLKAES